MDIYYEVIGRGYPIVLLHGNGEDHHIYDQLVSLLKDQYQCILIDSRYHGQSVHEGHLSYQQMCQDVIDIIDERKIEKYDVIGFSDGGIVSLLLAMNDQRVKHIVSIGANTKPSMIKWIYLIPMYLQKLCLLPFCLYHPKARLQYKMINLMLKEPHINYQDLKQIDIPVLIMAGEYDMIKEIDTQSIGEALPYSVIKIIDGGNHFLLRDSFRQTSQEIILFLNACHQEEE